MPRGKTFTAEPIIGKLREAEVELARGKAPPVAMLIYSLILIWFAREGHRHWQPGDRGSYATKRDPSFAAMLAGLKRRSVRRYVLSLPLDTLGPRKLFRILETRSNWPLKLQKPSFVLTTRN